jgi:hypothetical protein
MLNETNGTRGVSGLEGMQTVTEPWDYMVLIVAPIFILLGTVGNVLSIIVLLRLARKGATMSIYLVALAASDIVVLWNGCFPLWLSKLGVTHFALLHITVCKVSVFAQSLFTHMSSWLQVTVTIARMMAVCSPFKVQFRCVPKLSVAVIASLLCVLTGLNLHFFFEMDYIQPRSKIICWGTGYHYYFLQNIWPWIDMAVYALAPAIILTVGTICIRVKVVSSQKLTQRQPNPVNSKSVPKVVTRQIDKNAAMTAMLITINVVFVLCITPICVFLIINTFVVFTYSVELWWWVFFISQMLTFLNHSINFLLYSISGSRFREELKSLFRTNTNRNRQNGFSSQVTQSQVNIGMTNTC